MLISRGYEVVGEASDVGNRVNIATMIKTQPAAVLPKGLR